MLREQKELGTPAGLKAAEYFERGLLVPDEITIEVVRQWLDGIGGSWALDGFPRTVRQAEAFDAMLGDLGEKVDSALLILADEPVIRDRVMHRVVCKACGAVFRQGVHVTQDTDPCPRCGGALGRRKDDDPNALTDRLSEYRGKTEPVIAYYEARGTLRRIDGERAPEQVFAEITAALEGAPSANL
jgi:adenylate kinase